MNPIDPAGASDPTLTPAGMGDAAHLGTPTFASWSLPGACDLGAVDTNAAERIFARILEPPALPERIGKFAVLELLDGGSYGWVFRGRDPLTGRLVALKVPKLPVALDGPGGDSFLREARAARGQTHPNVVTVLEVGIHDQSYYIASEFVEGPTLRRWLRAHEGPIPCATAARLIQRLASALGTVHALGVVHRDLKPENILLAADGPAEFGFSDGADTWIPRIADFGLASLPEDAHRSARIETRVGTLAFLPPEQLDGTPSPPLASGDIYALGVILYETLGGRLPFQAESFAGLSHQIVHHEPVSPRVLRPDLPRDLETICLKCLQKEPSRRYATAKELADDLTRYLNNEPIRARPISRVEHVARWLRRNPSEAALAAVAAVAVAGLFCGFVAYSAHLETVNQRLVAEKRAHQRETITREQALENDRLHVISQQLLHDCPEPAYRILDELHASGAAASFTQCYLRHQARRQLTLLTGHAGKVDCAFAVAPDLGRSLAVSSSAADGTIRLWDLDRRTLLHTIHRTAAQLLPAVDGRSFWVADRTCTHPDIPVRIERLDARTLEPIGEPLMVEGLSGCLRLAPLCDGRLMVGASQHQAARIWDPAARCWSGRVYFEGYPLDVVAAPHADWAGALVQIPGQPVYAAFARVRGPDLVFAVDRHVRHGELAHSFLAVAANRALFASLDDGELCFFFPESPRCMRHRDRAAGLSTNGVMALSPGGQMHAFANLKNKTVDLTDVSRVLNKFPTVGQYARLSCGDFIPQTLCFDGDGGNLLMTAQDDPRVWVWHLRPPSEEQDCGTTEISDLVHTADGRYFIMGDSDRRVAAFEWNAQQGYALRQVHQWELSEVSAVAISHDDELVASGTWDESGDITLHKFADMQPVGVLHGHQGPIRDLAFSPDGRFLLSASKDNTARLWDVATRQQVRLLHTFGNRARCVAFSPDGALAAIAGQDGVLLIYDARSWRRLLRHVRDTGINAIAFSPDSRRLALGEQDGDLLMLDLMTGQPTEVARAHAGIGGVMSLDFHPNGVELASGGADGCVAVWNVVTGLEMIRQAKHRGEVPAVRFSPDGTRLLSAGRDGKVCYFLTDR
jgi:serine/threonine protein kinase/WD40 repeat protein